MALIGHSDKSKKTNLKKVKKKNMKNKKMVIGTILLLFTINGLCNIINVFADSWNDIEISPSSYMYVNPYTLEYKDELKLSVSSTGTINIYIMNAEQFSTLQNSGGLIWEYCMRWKDTTYLTYTFLVQEDGVYYVVLYNKNLLYERIVDMQITIDYYHEPIDPFDPYDETMENTFWKLLINIVIPIVAIVLVITVPIIIIKIYKKRTEEVVVIQKKEIPKIYCPECGIEILDITKEYCSKCGSKIIK